MLIDTHCHLNYEPLYEQRQAVIRQSVESHIAAIIVPGTDLKSSRKAIQLSEEFTPVYAAVGIHPNDLDEAPQNWQSELIRLAEHPRVKAIGEIGLDYYRDDTARESQRECFGQQIEIARQLQLPFIVHNRRADHDIQEILFEHRYYHGVLHCFASDEYFANEMLKLGMHISFTGNITYGTKRIQRALQAIPFDRLMLETDAPFITPVPFKKETNEPAYLPYIARKISELKTTVIDDVIRMTGTTATKFFNLPL